MSVELIIDCTDATSQSPYSFSQSSEDAPASGGSGVALVINCTLQQSPYIYEQRAPSDCPEEAEFCCPYDKSHFASVLVSSDNETFVNEDGDYISLSQ